jgi:hypothetical protein
MSEIYAHFNTELHVEFDVLGYCVDTFKGPTIYWFIDINYEDQ